MKKKEFKKLLLNEKPINILECLFLNKKMYETQIAKEIDTTYSHVVKVLNVFKEQKLINFEKKNRTKYVTLSVKGEKVAMNFVKAIAALKE